MMAWTIPAMPVPMVDQAYDENGKANGQNQNQTTMAAFL
jgi:hypothetical protein